MVIAVDWAEQKYNTLKKILLLNDIMESCGFLMTDDMGFVENLETENM